MLLVLIVISGGIYVFTLPDTNAKPDENNKAFDEEFQTFLSNLEVDSTNEYKENVIRSDYGNYKTTPRYPYPQKLKTGETIELNTADTTDLKKIPKIGSGFAGRIAKYRESLGGYISMDQLKEVWGMDDYLYEDIKPYLTFEPKIRKLKINTASFQELIKHPYINYKQAQIIVDIRERKDNISSIKRLGLLDEFSEKDIRRLSPYLSFD